MLILFGLTLFASAFLLFCCEPMVGKMVLPILGGAAAVWTTCVLFFQTMLLAGYVYAHVLGKLKRVQNQILVHSALLLIALAFLPIRFFAASGRPSEAPVTWLLMHLFLAAGIPFAALSATAPLLQNWFAKTPAAHSRDPYFLYALSNAGSLLALIAYPVLIEPNYGVSAQSRIWLYGYGVLLTMVTLSAIVIWNRTLESHAKELSLSDDVDVAPSWKTRGYWLGAAFVPSGLMLAVTNHISLNIGSMPFLWVVPLAVYLLTFILAFAQRLRPSTRIVSAITTGVLIVLFPIAAAGPQFYGGNIWMLMSFHIVILFFGGLLCHSSLADRRPSTRYLTEFYFVMALGGVLGGVFTAIAAPVMFTTIFEYPLLVAMIAFFRTAAKPARAFRWFHLAAVAGYIVLLEVTLRVLNRARVNVSNVALPWHWNEINKDTAIIAAAALVIVITILLWRKNVLLFALAFEVLTIFMTVELPKQFESETLVHAARNFFGVKKVVFDPNDNRRKLLHGDTLHGVESLDPALAGTPLLYYYRDGPFGDVMSILDRRPQSRIGVVGLGTGSIAAYADATRHITFFDVDPQIVDIANQDFSFIRRCGANCDIVIGDGRLAIQAQPDARFDMIILDAFNSDSIPAHLISREAVRMYLSKLREDGMLLFHVSNRYLDVEKLATVIAYDEGLPAFARPKGEYVAAVRNAEYFNDIRNRAEWIQRERPGDIEPWTDDYSNMMSVIRWK